MNVSTVSEMLNVQLNVDRSVGAVKALRDVIDFLDRDKVTGGSLTAPLEIRFSASAGTYDLSPLASDAEVLL